jgi:glycosyltransferase involved in cell wall biosynthesis
MRILYHHRTLGDGAEGIHVREMVRAFRQIGHEVRVIGPVGEQTPEQSATRFGALTAMKRWMPVALFELLELGYTAYCFCKMLLHIRSFKPDLIYDRYIVFNAGGIFAGRVTGIPVFLEVNAPLAFERGREKDERLFFRKLSMAMERWISANSTRTIVVSTPLREYLESVGVPKGHCIVMPNGVDPDRFKPREKDEALRSELGIPPGSFVVGFTGILRHWHGLDLLLEAFNLLVKRGADVALLVVGDGPYRPTMEQIARERGLDKLLFITGRVSHERVPNYVSIFDAAVSPRATFYASPMKVIEYMALGKPVVVPGGKNFLDMIDDGVHGVTFTDGNAEDLARAVASLYEDRTRCAELGRAARSKVETRLNWEWNAREVSRLRSVDQPLAKVVSMTRGS